MSVREDSVRSLEAIAEVVDEVLRDSPADETEIAWIEARRGTAATRGGQVDTSETPQRTVLVRVIERGRMGSHRTGSAERGEIAGAVRLALAQSRVNQPLRGLPHLPADETPLAALPELRCPELALWGRQDAERWLEERQRRRETLRLAWCDGRVVVSNSRGVRRRAAATSVYLEVRMGRRPGAGRATGAARRLADLAADELLERAAERHAQGDAAELPSEALPCVLSPEATIEIVELLNRTAFTASSYSDGSSLLREHLGVQVFDRAVTLRDDATDPAGLPFPFDLEGTAKRPVDLILQGTPKTPALDQRQAAQLGLPPTAHAVSGNDARADNLFLLPGEAGLADLLQAAAGGVWIGWLEGLECVDPRRLQLRGRALGLRRIRDGRLAEGLPDARWEESLLRALSERPLLGRDTARTLSHDGLLGGIVAPALALPSLGRLAVLPQE